MSESLPPPSDPPTEVVAREMRGRAKEMFEHALSECSIPRAFSKHVLYDRGELRLGNDVYALGSFSRTLVVSIGKAGHTMAEALANTVGTGLTGIIACPQAPPPPPKPPMPPTPCTIPPAPSPVPAAPPRSPPIRFPLKPPPPPLPLESGLQPTAREFASVT